MTIYTPTGTGLPEAEAFRQLAPTPIDEEHRFDLGDGYDWMGRAPDAAVSSWGRDGWDAADLPLVGFRRYRAKGSGLYCWAERVEGDVTVRLYPTEADRDRALDRIESDVTVCRYATEAGRDRALDLAIEWYWRRREWPPGPMADALSRHAYGELPDRFRGPFTWARAENERGRP